MGTVALVGQEPFLQRQARRVDGGVVDGGVVDGGVGDGGVGLGPGLVGTSCELLGN